MDKLVENLQNFNFTKIEAEVYISLLRNGQLNGSQISKLLGISRTSVYSALDSLYGKGHVFMLAGEPTMYRVQDPKLLVNEIKKSFLNSIDFLDAHLSCFQTDISEDQFWNIKGYDNFISNTKRLLLSAKKEVYISTNFELQLFEKEIKYLTENNIRIVVFSFEDLQIKNFQVEFYHHVDRTTVSEGRRWMMVVDNSHAFIANENKFDEVFGTFTQNSLMVSIISEHIHHDIYLLKLKQKYNRNLVSEDILIKSEFERNSMLLKDINFD